MKGLKRGGRIRSAPTKAKARAKRKDASSPALAKKLATRPKISANRDENPATLRRALAEAYQREAATADVLKIISRSAFDLQTVLDALVELAAKLCVADQAAIIQQKGLVYRPVANYGYTAEAWQLLQASETRSGPANRSILERATVHIRDVLAEPEASGLKFQGATGTRTTLAVPLLREGMPIGALTLHRRIVQPFTDKQIELVTTFANQAVIAIENTRLLNELRELLEQQTATSEVLSVISSSPSELQPVFNAMLERAGRVCDAKFGSLVLYEGGSRFRRVSTYGIIQSFTELRQLGSTINLSNPTFGLGLLAASKQVVHIEDLADEWASTGKPESARQLIELGGARTFLGVPMLRGGELVGALTIYRQEVHPFTDKQIELVQNFAKQAVIAIENARLLNELRESLDQQTATAEVLQVVSRSPGELQPVFETMLANAVRVCDANFGNIYSWDGDSLCIMAAHNTPPAFAEARRTSPFRPGPETPTGRMVATKTVTQVADLAAERGYAEGDPLFVQSVEVGGIRTLLSVPMLKENELIGAVTIYRNEVRPFTDKQIALVTNFAAQSVIAIENTRLLNELRESLQQQTATADVLKVISRSTFNLQAVLDTLVEISGPAVRGRSGRGDSSQGRVL